MLEASDVKRMGLGELGATDWLSSLVGGAQSLATALIGKKASESQAKAAAETAKAQIAAQEAQKQIAAAKAQQAAAQAQAAAVKQPQSQLSKYLPYVAGGLLVVGVITYLSSRRS